MCPCGGDMNIQKHYFAFVFDVESVGLHGEGFAVAGGVYLAGNPVSEFCFSCPVDAAFGSDMDRDWVKANVPAMEITHDTPAGVRAAFWDQWMAAKASFPDLLMAGECLWPVEAGFVARCVADDAERRNWEGPYPFHEISSVMLAAGMDPMATYERRPDEQPAHNPVGDARLSARLLFEAMKKLSLA